MSIQDKRIYKVTTPLKDDELLFQSMNGTEQLGRLFQYDLQLLSTKADIKLEDVLGKSMTVRMMLAKGKERLFNGVVSQFSMVGSSGNFLVYQATLRPWLWFLTRKSDCRIFQEKKVPDIIKEIFRDCGYSDFKENLSGSYRIWDYCVQYRETDFNFVSRLMEQEGIYYYFTHENGKHTLVLSDSYSSHSSVSGEKKIPFRQKQNALPGLEIISELSVSREIQPGAYLLNDFDFEKPKTKLDTVSRKKLGHAKDDGEIYDYPGEYSETKDGDQYSSIRLEELQAGYEHVYGASNARNLMAGGLFDLVEYARKDQNQEYLITSNSYMLESSGYESGTSGSGDNYSCNFTAIPGTRPFRSSRVTPKPVVQGPQTAMVVGKSGEEIWTDKYGRVKVQFHWDRIGKEDENSSCWIRVAQVWAGKKWGGMFIPRIGQEVIVEFLEGDPDRPIVTGRVYNDDCMPPYDLPDNQTQSGIKTRSTKGGDTKMYNELRFEDKKGNEEVYFHAEKDFNRVVENNDTLKVGVGEGVPNKPDEGNQEIEIYNDQKLVIGKESGKGSQTIDIEKDRTTSIVTGNDKLTIKKGDHTMTIKSGDHTIKISAGKSSITAAKSIELKVGGSSIKIEPAKITIKSTQIMIEGSAKVEVKGAMTDIKGSGMVNVKGGIVKIN